MALSTLTVLLCPRALSTARELGSGEPRNTLPPLTEPPHKLRSHPVAAKTMNPFRHAHMQPFTYVLRANIAKAVGGGAEEGGNPQRIAKTSLFLFFETFAGFQTWLLKEFLVLFHLNMQV